jgi:hypothetical protein
VGLAAGLRSSIDAWFLFPFEEPSPEFLDYVRELQAQMLFGRKPLEILELFARWQATSQEHSNRPVKLDYVIHLSGTCGLSIL